MLPEIRSATVEDAEAAAWCHLLCWREAYAGLVPAGRLLERTSDLDRRIERWTTGAEEGRLRWIALNPDPAAAVEDRVVGFSAAGPGRDEDAPTTLELEAIYTRQAWWGTGLGGRLLEVCHRQRPGQPVGVRGQRPRAHVLPAQRFHRGRRPQARPVLRPDGDPAGPPLVPPALLCRARFTAETRASHRGNRRGSIWSYRGKPPRVRSARSMSDQECP